MILGVPILEHFRVFVFQAWCATGNCFSLQKEHDTAIKFFQRAIQVGITYYLLVHYKALFTSMNPMYHIYWAIIHV